MRAHDYGRMQPEKRVKVVPQNFGILREETVPVRAKEKPHFLRRFLAAQEETENEEWCKR